MTELSLNIERTLQAPLQAVFKAWLDPELLGKFMIPGEGMSTAKVTSDAKVGGRFSIVMVGKAGDLPHGGEYQVINKFSQIVFTWESPFSIEGSKVTLNFRGDELQTHLELIHVKFPDEESRSNHEGGWSSIISHLERVLNPETTARSV